MTAPRTDYRATMARVAALIEANGPQDCVGIRHAIGASKSSNWTAAAVRFGWLVRAPHRHGQPRARFALGPCDSWRRGEIPNVRGPKAPGADELLVRAVAAAAYHVQVMTQPCLKGDRPHRDAARVGALELAAELFAELLQVRPDVVVHAELVGGAA